MTDPRLPGGSSCDTVRDLAASFVLEQAAVPQADAIVDAVRELIADRKRTAVDRSPQLALA